jgi:RHS repeat-associated protein
MRFVALKNGSNLRYVHLDHLGSTSVVTNTSGTEYGRIRYYPYGSQRDSSGFLDTDKKFTGQRLDGTGLYYYGARYYDPVIGRFISPDTVGPSPLNPQSYNRYSYCFNNPLALIDPTGNWPNWSNVGKWVKDNVVAPVIETAVDVAKTAQSAVALLADPSVENAKEFGMNLGNVALGHGTVENIANAIESGDWGAAALNIGMGAVSLASNFVAPGGAKVVTSVAGKGIIKEGVASAAENVVYQSFNTVTKKVNYVGITKNFERRATEQFAEKGIQIIKIKGLSNLSRADARAAEQVLIERYGLMKNGGSLLNKINSIAKSSSIYDESIQRGIDLLRSAGYSGL